MSTWCQNEDFLCPGDFLELLYKSENLNERKQEHVSNEAEHRKRFQHIMDKQTAQSSSSRDRSRSPINFSSDSAPDGALGRDDRENDASEGDDSTFIAPDAHALYVSPETHDRNAGSQSKVSEGRGRRRGVRVRGVRGTNARGRGNRGRKNQWEVGHPLTEIWTNDKDVPRELVNLALDVLKRRKLGLRDTLASDRNYRESASESDDEEFVDANDAADGVLSDFEWCPMDSFQGREEEFRYERTGPLSVFASAYEAFRTFWNDDILSLIVNETNKHATTIASANFQTEWVPTNDHEIMCLFAFWIMLGVVRMPTITSCFSVDPLLKTEIFSRIFTRRRYEMLCRALNFIESETASNKPNVSTTTDDTSDPLYRLRPIMAHLNYSFQTNYVLSKDICLDESSIVLEGRSTTKQHVESKLSKLEMKTYEVCESATGYLWSFAVDSDKQPASEPDSGEANSTSIAKKLIGPLLNKGYRIFMDSWHNSLSLARYLKQNGTDCVGALRQNSKEIPVLIKKALLKKGQLIARHSGDVTVLSWRDEKRVTMMSTCHGSACGLPTVISRPTTRQVPFQPQVVLDYNKSMEGIDLKDQILDSYLIEKKCCTKLYMKIFQLLINYSIHNCRILLQLSTQTHKDHLAFRLKLVDSILTAHLMKRPQSRRYTTSSIRAPHETPGRYVASAHWPTLLDTTESAAANKRKIWKRCFVCLRAGRKDQRTSYCCESCHVPLCVHNCFKEYHTVEIL